MPEQVPLPPTDEHSDEESLAPVATGDALRAQFRALRGLVDPGNPSDSTDMIREMREARSAWPSTSSTPMSR